jgi:hypothetical protein
MTTALNEQLDEILRLRQTDSAQVVAEALHAGMQQVYLDTVLEAYLHGRLSRTEAIERVGAGNIDRAEEEHRIMQEDVSWGLRG